MKAATIIDGKIADGFKKLQAMNLGDGPMVFDVRIKSVFIQARPDGLIELEVMDGVELGWMYRRDVDIASYMKDGVLQSVKFSHLKDFSIAIASKLGKQVSETPKAYHSVSANGKKYYYIKEDDFLTIQDHGG